MTTPEREAAAAQMKAAMEIVNAALVELRKHQMYCAMRFYTVRHGEDQTQAHLVVKSCLNSSECYVKADVWYAEGHS